LDSAGDLFIAESGNNRLREVNAATGIISSVAGTGVGGHNGDEIMATTAELMSPQGVAVDSMGNILIADTNNRRIREVTINATLPSTDIGATSPSQIILVQLQAASTISSITVPKAQNGVQEFVVGSATGCTMDGVTVNSAGAVCVVPVTFAPQYPGVRSGALTVNNGATAFGTVGLTGVGTGPQVAFTPGTISTVAGNGTQGSSGDGAAATSAELSTPFDTAVDSAGNIYIADTSNNRIRKVDTSGNISTVAGNGTQGYSGDGSVATSAELYSPFGVAVDSAGNIYIADSSNNRIRKVDTSGNISTVAGNGTGGYGGDGGAATSAELNSPYGVAVDRAGNIYIADYANNRIRKVDTSGTISTVAGNGTQGYSGDGSAATSAELNSPGGVAMDSAGNIYILDSSNNRIRKVDVSTSSLRFATATNVGTTDTTDGTQTATISNIGNQSLTLSAGGVSGNPIYPASFIENSSDTALCAAGATLTAGTSCDLSVDFVPASTGFITGNLVLGDNALNVSGSTQTIAMSGSGIAIQPVLSFAAIGSQTFGVAPFAVSAASASSGAITYSVTSGPATILGNMVTITGVGTVVLNASQVASGNYAAATATVSFSVAAETRTLSFTTIATQTFGHAAFAVSASSASSGTISYSVVSGPATIAGNMVTLTGAGTVVLSASQAANGNYAAAAATTSFTVNPETPTITWPTPAAITYGTALSAAQLDATASVPGTFAYSPAVGTTPGVGSDQLSVTFTPTDTTDYTTATATVSLVVNSPSNPTPVFGSMSPAFTSAGGVAFTLTINGSGFVSGSTVYWGTTALATQVVSATQLTVPVTAAEIASAGITPITVQTPTPGGGTSSPLQFEVDSTNSATTPPSFTVATVTVTAGTTASYSLTLPSTVESVTVSCLNLPTGAACSYSSTNNALSITTSSTTPKGTYQVTVVFTETVTGAATSWILLPFFLLPLVFLRRRMAARSYWVTACLGLVLVTAAAYTSGCGGGGTSTTTPPPQSHQVVSSGAVSLTVQQAANGNYAAAAATTSFTVNPETPTITWAAPAAITDTTNPSTTPTGSVTFTDTTTSPAPSGDSCYTLHPAIRCRVKAQDIIDLRFTLVQDNILRELSD
jgi:hypothetical protein